MQHYFIHLITHLINITMPMTTTTGMLKKKTILTFNTIAIAFLKELKNQDDQLKVIFKKNYRTFSKLSDAHINTFIANIMPFKDLLLTGDKAAILKDENLMKKDVMKSFSLKKIFTRVKEEEYDIVITYLYTMYLFAHIYSEIEPEAHTEKVKVVVEGEDAVENDGESYAGIEELNALLMNSLDYIHALDSTNNLADISTEILDEDVNNILEKIKGYKRMCRPNVFSVPDDDESGGLSVAPSEEALDSMFSGSKIGELAKEMSEELDMSSLQNIENPEQLLDMNNIMKAFSGEGGGDNPIGEIIKKVGEKLASKIAAGDISQEELVADSMKMMGQMGGMGGMGGMGQMSGLMASLMDQMGGGAGGDDPFSAPPPAPPPATAIGAGSGARDSAARQRLAKKAASRKSTGSK